MNKNNTERLIDTICRNDVKELLPDTVGLVLPLLVKYKDPSKIGGLIGLLSFIIEYQEIVVDNVRIYQRDKLDNQIEILENVQWLRDNYLSIIKT